MLNTCKSLIINVMGGVNLRSMLSHTFSPRQDEVACLGFFYPPLQRGQGDSTNPGRPSRVPSPESNNLESLNLKHIIINSLNQHTNETNIFESL